MRTVTVSMESISPYSPSKFYEVDKKDREQPDDYEKRTWRERCHYDLTSGEMFIPPMCFKKSLDQAATMRGMKVKGKGQATYSKYFRVGILVIEGLHLGLQKEAVDGEWLFVPSDGKPGGGKRVKKCFPIVREWSGKVAYTILDDSLITPEVFEPHVIDAGNFVGLGRFRPERGGFYGRYKVNKIEWK